jgi:tRNA(adenine34) deaminase
VLDDLYWLRYAFLLAERSVELGDYAFGAALVVGDGDLLVESLQDVERSGDWLAHAELSLLHDAARRWTRTELATATLYSSTEPCPMCTGAVAWSVNRLVYGLSQAEMYRRFAMEDAPPRFVEPWDCRSILEHLAPPMEVIGPLLEDEGAVAHAMWLERYRGATGGR